MSAETGLRQEPPLFSIVVVNKNGAAFLETALRSIFDQPGADYEVLLVDGGSTDGSQEVLRRYQARFSWCVSEPDAGQSAALNKGFRRATGRYLFWINSDDVLLPGALEAFRACLRRDPAVQWMVAQQLYIDAADRIVRCVRDGAWHGWLFRHAPVRVYGPTAVLRRDLYARTGGFDETLHYAMDMDLWQRCLRFGARYQRVNRYCWGFRRHAASKTGPYMYTEVPDAMRAEHRRIYHSHGLRITWGGLMLQRVWRVLNGSYLRAAIDTARLRGRPWSDVRAEAF